MISLINFVPGNERVKCEYLSGLKYVKRGRMECYSDRYEDYSTLEGSQSACTRDNNCQGVYDLGCDAVGSFYLCPLNAQLAFSFGRSCVYTKGREKRIAQSQ